MIDKPQYTAQENGWEGAAHEKENLPLCRHNCFPSLSLVWDERKDQDLKFSEKGKKQLWNVFFFFNAVSMINVGLDTR